MEKISFLKIFALSLKHAAKDAYNSLGYLFIISIAWFASFFFPFVTFFILFTQVFSGTQKEFFMAGLMFLVAILIFVPLLVGPVTSSLFTVNNMRKELYVGMRDFRKALKTYYWNSVRVYGIASLIGVCAICNFVISLNYNDILMKLIGLFSIYILLVLVLMSFYFPALICYKHKTKEVFRKSFALLLDNFGVTLMQFILLAAFFFLGTVPIIPIVLVFGGFYVMLLNSMFDLVYSKYTEVENEEKMITDGGDGEQ